MTIHKGLPLASGIGSSGASAVAAVVATNELLGRPAPMPMLLECAMAGEQAGCGAIHPDNVTPSLYGGFILARSAQPPDIVRLPVPDGLACAVLHPQIEIETGAARKLLGDQVALRGCDAAVGERRRVLWRRFTRSIWRCCRVRSSITIAEPKRAVAGAGICRGEGRRDVDAGALGCSLSGSGPSIFALAASLDIARAAGDAMQRAFDAASTVGADLWVCPVGRQGARVISILGFHGCHGFGSPRGGRRPLIGRTRRDQESSMRAALLIRLARPIGGLRPALRGERIRAPCVSSVNPCNPWTQDDLRQHAR